MILFFLIVCFSTESNIYIVLQNPEEDWAYLDRSLLENHVHLFAHDVLHAQGRLCKISCFLVMRESLLKLQIKEELAKLIVLPV
jgi:hypothetical protein